MFKCTAYFYTKNLGPVEAFATKGWEFYGGGDSCVMSAEDESYVLLQDKMLEMVDSLKPQGISPSIVRIEGHASWRFLKKG